MVQMKEKPKGENGAEGTICVNALKLSRGLKTTFEGIALVFGSLGAGTEFHESLSSAQEASAHAAPKRDSPNESAEREDKAERKDKEQPPEQTQSEPRGTQPIEPAASVNPAPTETAPASSLTIDDITKIIVSKIKQNRSNNEKIEKLVQSFGVQSVKAIPPEKYEVFMTELAAI